MPRRENHMHVVKSWSEGPVSYRLIVEPEITPVRGNAMCSGDSGADREVEDDILARLESGDVWAWFRATVEARAFGFSEQDSLGCNSYASEHDFLQAECEGYISDLVKGARASLDYSMLRARVALDEAEMQGYWNE